MVALYELIILARLMRGPAHGYLMAKIINDVIGPFAKLSNGRFYPLLAKLEREGLIAVVPAEPNPERNTRRFTITDAGRTRFRRLMLDISVSPGDHQRVFLFKITAFDLLDSRERLHVIDHYLHYCDAHVMHTNLECDELDRHAQEGVLLPVEREAIQEVIRHLNRQWSQEADWVRSLRAKYTESPDLAEEETAATL